MNESHLVTVRELAQILGTSERSIYRLTEGGFIPHYRLGGRIRGPLRFDPAEVRGALRRAPSEVQSA